MYILYNFPHVLKQATAPISLPFLNSETFEVEKNQEYEQQQQHECEDLPFVILIIDRT